MIDFLNRDFRLMNFFWMIIEGVNFHHMVVFTFTDLSRFRVAIYAFGWGLPHLIMGAYALVRANVGPADDVCWTSDIGLWELLYIIPCYLCFLVSGLLFWSVSKTFSSSGEPRPLHQPPSSDRSEADAADQEQPQPLHEPLCETRREDLPRPPAHLRPAVRHRGRSGGSDGDLQQLCPLHPLPADNCGGAAGHHRHHGALLSQ